MIDISIFQCYNVGTTKRKEMITMKKTCIKTQKIRQLQNTQIIKAKRDDRPPTQGGVLLG